MPGAIQSILDAAPCIPHPAFFNAPCCFAWLFMQAADPNKPPLRFRKLRIAWSFFCGILCLLLIVLWVRSYRWLDVIEVPVPNAKRLFLNTGMGCIQALLDDGSRGRVRPWRVRHKRVQELLDTIEQINKAESAMGVRPTHSLSYHKFGFVGDTLCVPHWFLVLLFTTFAAVPWLRLRFSLRTLLIATTLIAVALGAIVLAA
jgi:hypothetical protein